MDDRGLADQVAKPQASLIICYVLQRYQSLALDHVISLLSTLAHP